MPEKAREMSLAYPVISGRASLALSDSSLNESYPELVDALAKKGITTRAGLVKAVHGQGVNLTTAQRSVTKIVDGQHHRLRNGTSPIGQAVFKAAGWPIPETAPKPAFKRGSRSCKSLSNYPLNKCYPELVQALAAKGIESRSDLVRSLQDRGYTAVGAQGALRRLFKGALFSLSGAPSSAGKHVLEIAEITIREAPKGTGLSKYPLSKKHPSLVQALANKGIRTRLALIRSLQDRGFSAGKAKTAVRRLLEGALFSSSGVPNSAGKHVLEMAGLPASESLKGTGLSTHPLNKKYSSLIEELENKGIRTKPDLLRSMQDQGLTARAAQAAVRKFLHGSLYRAHGKLNAAGKAIFQILQRPIPEKTPLAKGNRGSPSKRLSNFPLNDTHPELLQALSDKGIETRTDLIRSLQDRGYTEVAAKSALGRLLKGSLYRASGTPKSAGKAVFEIAGRPIPEDRPQPDSTLARMPQAWPPAKAAEGRLGNTTARRPRTHAPDR